MSNMIIQLNKDIMKYDLKDLVCNCVNCVGEAFAQNGAYQHIIGAALM